MYTSYVQFWDRISSTPPLSEDADSADNADETKKILNKLTIVYSPLSRAKITCFSVVPERFHEYCVELDCLRETTPFEHVIPYTVVERTKAFQQWLRNTDAEVIVVFGHSQYFKRCLLSSIHVCTISTIRTIGHLTHD